MSAALILGLVGGLLILAFLANRVFSISRIPDVVLLMGLGVLLGPGLHLLDAQRFSTATNLLGTLAIILVLFEGGLELNLGNTLRHFPGALLLATLAYLFSTGLVALVLVKGLHVPLLAGVMVGAVLGCTSSTVVLPVLQQMGADDAVKATLTLEASWGDVLAVLTVGLLLGLKDQPGPVASGLVRGFAVQVGVALVFAVAAGILWSRLLHALSEQRFWQVLTFSVVLVLYAGMEAIGANGLIAVLGFGLTLANFPEIDAGLGFGDAVATSVESQQSLLTFHSELAFLVRTFFFVLIGVVAELRVFREHPLLTAGTLGALFVARWLAMQCSRWSWKDIGAQGRDVILWMLPRGLITVVLAIDVVKARPVELEFLPGLAFAVILATNLLLVFGSVLARRRQPAAAAVTALNLDSTGDANDAPTQEELTAATGAAHQRRRRTINVALLALLALGGFVFWYGSRPANSPQGPVEAWIASHLHRKH
ncbi:MAG TPA: cation:proton antiporter [Candidatus Sulfotelmatobacter sp.]|jgi:cell volume regulation protein A